MITNGNNTVDSLAFIPDLVVVPRLFNPPREGYAAWLHNDVDNPGKIIKEGTISHKILDAEGEARYYGTLLPKIMTGEYERSLLLNYQPDDGARLAIENSYFPGELGQIERMEDLPLELRWAASAKRVRLLFDSGHPLYIGVYQSVERYRMFDPVLTFMGQRQYIVGSPSSLHRRFTANGHYEAIDRARQWFIEEREKEINFTKKEAAAQKIPRLVSDLLGVVLDAENEIVDETGTRIAWKNGGVHGRFGVMSFTWCYIMQCSPGTAGRMAALAQQEAAKHGQSAPLRLNLTGRVPVYLRFTIEPDGNGLKYAGGAVRSHSRLPNKYGVFSEGSNSPSILITLTGKEQETITVERISKENRHRREKIAHSLAPASWKLTEWDKVAWGAWTGLKAIARKQKI